MAPLLHSWHLIRTLLTLGSHRMLVGQSGALWIVTALPYYNMVWTGKPKKTIHGRPGEEPSADVNWL